MCATQDATFLLFARNKDQHPYTRLTIAVIMMHNICDK